MRCLQYWAATPELSLHYNGSNGAAGLRLLGASDADWAGCPVTRKSTTGWIFLLAAGAISWLSKRQTSLALSSCEAESQALTSAAKEANWLRDILGEVGYSRQGPTPIMVDNEAAIELSKNPKYHSRTKHVQLSFLYTREQQEKGVIKVLKVPTEDQPADFLTKNVAADTLQSCIELSGMGEPPAGK